jgi:DNA-binding GntR family transcriptional regulator
VTTPHEPPSGGYRGVAEALRVRIAAGEIAGGRLPPEGVLVAEFGVARDTIRRALALLTDEGLIRTTHGRGHFVREAGRGDAGSARYAVVAEALKEQIGSGRLLPGSVLFSEAAVQEEFDVSRNTARRAFAQLEAWGLIERRDGRRYVCAAED